MDRIGDALRGCCCCGHEKTPARNVGCLPRRAPVPGTGWGCVVCGLPSDGAIYLACDRCALEEREPRYVCKGYPSSGQRVPIGELGPEPFLHDMAQHDPGD